MKDAILYRLQCLVIQSRELARRSGKPGVAAATVANARDIARTTRALEVRYGVRVSF